MANTVDPKRFPRISRRMVRFERLNPHICNRKMRLKLKPVGTGSIFNLKLLPQMTLTKPVENKTRKKWSKESYYRN